MARKINRVVVDRKKIMELCVKEREIVRKRKGIIEREREKEKE